MKTIAILAAITTLLVQASPGAPYTVEDLGSAYSVYGRQSRVINDAGEIIANDSSDNGHAFLRTGGAWQDLGALNTSAGSAASFARGLNNPGAIAGQADTGSGGQTEAFQHGGDGGSISALGIVDGEGQDIEATALALNDLGVIVGSKINTADQTATPFLFKAGAGLLASPGGSDYYFALNNYGDLLGRTTDEARRALVNGKPLPATTNGFAPQAINHAGQILLSVDDSKPIKGAWGLICNYGDGKIIKLPNLSKNMRGDTTYFDINDFGQVVGRGTDANNTPRAIFYSNETGLMSLDDLALTVGGVPARLIEACGINNKGQIVCNGYLEGDADDVVRVFLLTPSSPPALPLAATYNGPVEVGGDATGACSIVVSKTSSFTAKLIAPGISYSFAGKLANDAFNGPVSVRGVTLNVSLQADAAHQTISGAINDGATTYGVTLLRQVKLGIFAGKLTALIEIAAAPAPQGMGHGKVTVTKTGGITISGLLGDGLKYSASAKLRYDGTWVLFTPLYLKDAQPGGIAGVMKFDRMESQSDCAGTLRWHKPGAFTASVALKAAYFKAVKNTHVLRFGNQTNGAATFEFAAGNQSLAARTLAVSNKNVVTVTDPAPDPAALKVKLSASSGSLTGTFIHPVTNKAAPFNGVVQQKMNVAGGVFTGSESVAGSVLLTPH